MARKKKVVEVPAVAEEVVTESPAPAPAEPVADLSQNLKMTREEILSLKLAESEGRAASYQLALRQLQRDNYIAQIDPKGLMKKVGEEIVNAQKSVVAQQDSYRQIMRNVEARLKISMKDYSFDDATGILVKHSDM